MVPLSNLVTYSSITYDVGHRAASINEPARCLGVQEGRKKKYDDLFSSCCGRTFDGIEHCRNRHGKQSIVRLYCKFERANGYLFQC